MLFRSAYLRVEHGRWVRQDRSIKEIMAARDAHTPQRLANPALNALAEGMEKNREDHQRRKLDREASRTKADAERKARIARAVRSGVRRQESKQRRLFD